MFLLINIRFLFLVTNYGVITVFEFITYPKESKVSTFPVSLTYTKPLGTPDSLFFSTLYTCTCTTLSNCPLTLRYPEPP